MKKVETNCKFCKSCKYLGNWCAGNFSKNMNQCETILKNGIFTRILSHIKEVK